MITTTLNNDNAIATQQQRRIVTSQSTRRPFYAMQLELKKDQQKDLKARHLKSTQQEQLHSSNNSCKYVDYEDDDCLKDLFIIIFYACKIHSINLLFTDIILFN